MLLLIMLEAPATIIESRLTFATSNYNYKNKHFKFGTQADGSRGGRVFTGVCLFVCLSAFPHDISTKSSATAEEPRDALC